MANSCVFCHISDFGNANEHECSVFVANVVCLLKDSQVYACEREGRAVSVKRDDDAAGSRLDFVLPRRRSSRGQRSWEHDMASSLAGKII